MGALSKDRAKDYQDRFHTWKDDTIPAFHYGSHYSSATVVAHYLVRQEPFTAISQNLQGGCFDLPDRLFQSIESAWKMSSHQAIADVRELIPEFFCDCRFLKNINNLDLGVKQDGERVHNVNLPRWAKSAEDFIRLHREALESEHVSENLHHWVDLIFGYKQRGKEAELAQNVFFYLTYADCVDIDSIKDPIFRKATESQIAHFGQTPGQLFTVPHPPRYSKEERTRMATDPDLVESYYEDMMKNVQPDKMTVVAQKFSKLFARSKTLTLSKTKTLTGVT